MVCNRFLSGDKQEYRNALESRIGIERLERLERLKSGGHIYKDYRSLAKAFNTESRQLRKRKGI
jgi:hypothetical protein